MKRIVFEITRTSLRALAVEGPLAHPRVKQIVVESHSGQPSPETLRRLLARVQARRSGVMNAFPRDQAITRLLKFPSSRLEELTQMVQLSGKAQLPYPPEQAVVDFQVLDQVGGTSMVHLVACQRDQLEQHVALLRQAGLEPQLMTPNSWGVLAWYQRLGRSPDVREPVMVINVDSDHTDLVLIRQGQLVFSRSLSQGVREWQAGSDAEGPLAQELERSLSSLRNEWPGVDAQSFILTGLGPLEPWKEFFGQRLGKPVVIKQVAGSLQIPESVMRQTEAGPHASLVVVLGLALAEHLALVNLLPPETRQAQRQRRRMQQLVLTGSLLLSTLLVGAGLLSAHVNRQVLINELAVKTMNTLEAMTAETEAQERDIQVINRLLGLRRRLATMLAELFRVTAGQVILENLVFEGERHEFVVRGSASSTRDVLEYLRRLKDTGQWERVELRYSARRSTAAGARTDFEVVFHTQAHDGTASRLSP